MKTAEPIHPGEILLEEFLKAYDPQVSQTEAADRLGWSFVRLNQLTSRKRHAERQRERRRAPKIRPLRKSA